MQNQGGSASELISERIAELGGWRGETLSRMRKLIKGANPDIVEEWKWMGQPQAAPPDRAVLLARLGPSSMITLSAEAIQYQCVRSIGPHPRTPIRGQQQHA